MKIKFPETFPNITEEELLQPLSEWEKEHSIKGYIHDDGERLKETKIVFFGEHIKEAIRIIKDFFQNRRKR